MVQRKLLRLRKSENVKEKGQNICSEKSKLNNKFLTKKQSNKPLVDRFSVNINNCIYPR